jgi:hypothetical protein
VFLAVPEGRVLANVKRMGKAHTQNRRLQFNHWLINHCRLAVFKPTNMTNYYGRVMSTWYAVKTRLFAAHWAGKPLLWHIYPQEENAHIGQS